MVPHHCLRVSDGPHVSQQLNVLHNLGYKDTYLRDSTQWKPYRHEDEQRRRNV